MDAVKKKSKVKFEMENEMFSTKPTKKVVELLEATKKLNSQCTKPVKASDYGFKSNMILIVKESCTKEQIKAKFAERLNHDFNSFEDKRKLRV